ncbi:MAG: DUF3108 domain-containing protein [Bryobacteraceae bacterium]|nr:DUF3108 domain-containing protein [Bryobacteraceae bacterium]
MIFRVTGSATLAVLLGFAAGPVQKPAPKAKPPSLTKPQAAVAPATAQSQGSSTEKAAEPVVPPVAPVSPKPAAGKTETLRFNVNWPSGLSLGEGEFTAVQEGSEWSFSMKVDAAFPAFRLAESANSRASGDLCSLEFRKEATRGKRQIGEKTTFDPATLTATRTTGNGGGKSETRINACAKDALTFLWFARRELAAGRVPQSQPLFYGAAYQTRLQYTGTQRIRSGAEYVEADKLTAFLKGPASEFTVELYFARDAARTPIQASIPVALGRFTVEFER